MSNNSVFKIEYCVMVCRHSWWCGHVRGSLHRNWKWKLHFCGRLDADIEPGTEHGVVWFVLQHANIEMEMCQKLDADMDSWTEHGGLVCSSTYQHGGGNVAWLCYSSSLSYASFMVNDHASLTTRVVWFVLQHVKMEIAWASYLYCCVHAFMVGGALDWAWWSGLFFNMPTWRWHDCAIHRHCRIYSWLGAAWVWASLRLYLFKNKDLFFNLRTWRWHEYAIYTAVYMHAK
jgi:hypothetical protein